MLWVSAVRRLSAKDGSDDDSTGAGAVVVKATTVIRTTVPVNWTLADAAFAHGGKGASCFLAETLDIALQRVQDLYIHFHIGTNRSCGTTCAHAGKGDVETRKRVEDARLNCDSLYEHVKTCNSGEQKRKPVSWCK
jgi:hypothetical protein